MRAARKIFLEHGTQVPVAAIAKELGVSPAAVFVRMGTKSKLISAALWPPDPAVLALLETGAIEAAQFERRLLDIVVDIAVYTESEIPATFTLYAAGLRAKPGDDFSDVTPARLRRALTKRLREAVDAAVIRCDPRIAAEVIIGTLEARAMHAFLGKRAKTATWMHGATLQIPTYLSLLTPEYQTRFVQQMYHYSGSNAPQWPGQYCWPEGFLRRLAQYGGGQINFVMTPNLILDIRNAAKTLMTQIHIGREFTEGDGVPRLGPAVPQWFGETIGFWDGEALITWTSNVQGWINHGGFEFSNSLQSVEIYTPRVDAAGKQIGIKHEVVLYDEEALVDPVRIVQLWDKLGDLNDNDPFVYMECVPHMFPIDGVATPVTPGASFEYTYLDMYGRPWAQVWERYHEEGMERPEAEDIFSFE